MATKTKTKKALTPRQAEIKLGKILRGVDNSVAQIEKHSENIKGLVPEAQQILAGLANPPEAKAAPKPKAKPAPQAKAKPKAKAKDKPKTNKAKADNMKKPVDGRPPLKQAMQEVLNGDGEGMAASDIWKQVTAKYGYWSRQSLYNALKDAKLFKKTGDKFQSVSHEDEAAEKFIKSVKEDKETAEAV